MFKSKKKINFRKKSVPESIPLITMDSVYSQYGVESCEREEESLYQQHINLLFKPEDVTEEDQGYEHASTSSSCFSTARREAILEEREVIILEEEEELNNIDPGVHQYPKSEKNKLNQFLRLLNPLNLFLISVLGTAYFFERVQGIIPKTKLNNFDQNFSASSRDGYVPLRN